MNFATLSTTMDLGQARAAAEYDAIKAALVASGGNVKHAATALGVSRAHLHVLMRDLGLGDICAELRRVARAKRGSQKA